VEEEGNSSVTRGERKDRGYRKKGGTGVGGRGAVYLKGRDLLRRSKLKGHGRELPGVWNLINQGPAVWVSSPGAVGEGGCVIKSWLVTNGNAKVIKSPQLSKK